MCALWRCVFYACRSRCLCDSLRRHQQVPSQIHLTSHANRNTNLLYYYGMYVCSWVCSTAGAGPLVVRPDSGDPATTVVKVLEILGVLTSLLDRSVHSVNSCTSFHPTGAQCKLLGGGEGGGGPKLCFERFIGQCLMVSYIVECMCMFACTEMPWC